MSLSLVLYNQPQNDHYCHTYSSGYSIHPIRFADMPDIFSHELREDKNGVQEATVAAGMPPFSCHIAANNVEVGTEAGVVACWFDPAHWQKTVWT